MKLNTMVRLPDGREGTICYHNLDGDGGVWGRHEFDMPEAGFGDELPGPEFMLREKSIEDRFRRSGDHRKDVECVGEDFEVVE